MTVQQPCHVQIIHYLNIGNIGGFRYKGKIILILEDGEVVLTYSGIWTQMER